MTPDLYNTNTKRAIPKIRITDIMDAQLWVNYTRAPDDELIIHSPVTDEPYTHHPGNWGTFRQAKKNAETLETGGVAVVLDRLGNGLHLCCLRLDHSVIDVREVDEVDEVTFAPWAEELKGRFDSYTDCCKTDNAITIFFLITSKDMAILNEHLGLRGTPASLEYRGNRVRFFANAAFIKSSGELLLQSTWDLRVVLAQNFLEWITVIGADPVRQFMYEFNFKYAVVHDGDRVRIISQGYDPVANRKYWKYFTAREFELLHADREIHGFDGNRNEVTLGTAGDVWLRHPSRRSYKEGVVFDPTGREYPGQLNLFQGFALAPQEGDWSLLRNHIETIICRGNKEHARYLFDWIARMFQQPDKPAETAIVMRGKEGTGKGILMTAIRKIIGHHARLISQPRHLVGNFNAHLRDCLFLAADEAFFAGDVAHVGVLKSLITESHIMVERKGVDAISATNMLHMMMASNEDWVVPAGPESRRFFVLDVSDEHMQDNSYFTPIFKQLDSGGCEAFYHAMLCRCISEFRPQPVPVTDGLRRQRLLSLGVEFKWYLDCLSRGYFTLCDGGWNEWLSTDTLYRSYEIYARENHERRPIGREDFGKFLNDMGCRALRPRAIGAETRPRGYTIGRLDDARAAFVKATKLEISWTVYDEEVDSASGNRQGRVVVHAVP
jgi:hypothetical protein